MIMLHHSLITATFNIMHVCMKRLVSNCVYKINVVGGKLFTDPAFCCHVRRNTQASHNIFLNDTKHRHRYFRIKAKSYIDVSNIQGISLCEINIAENY